VTYIKLLSQNNLTYSYGTQNLAELVPTDSFPGFETSTSTPTKISLDMWK